jgi:protein ImuB
MVAGRFGLCAGQRLADARAAVPDLLSEPHEAEKDQASLLGLASWMERYSPWVAPDGVNGLLLDATGVAHLFGGEEAMRRDIVARLADYGFTARVAFGGTIGAGWAMARYGKSDTAGSKGTSSVAARQLLQRRSDGVVPSPLGKVDRAPRETDEVPLAADYNPLPIEALRIDAEAARTLRRLGLKTIGALMDIPRASLARRFRGESIHENVLLRLDELTGARHEALNAINPPSSFMAHRALMEPVISHEGLDAVLTGLTHALTQDLEAKAQGATRLILKLFKVDGGRAQIPAGLSAPSHDANHILRLLRPKLESLDAGFGIDAMTLEARETSPMAAHQHGFMEDDGGTSLAELNDRVMNRQEQAIAQLEAVESHVPERAERSAVIRQSREKAKTPSPTPRAPRPLLIFDNPEPARVIAAVPDGPPLRLTWRRVTRRIVRAQGPERIAPEWWHLNTSERPRDYYHVEDEQGRRYWLYRDGLYGEDNGLPPKWFVHGLSA